MILQVNDKNTLIISEFEDLDRFGYTIITKTI